MREDQEGPYEVGPLTAACADRLAQAWFDILVDVNPTQDAPEVRPRIEKSVTELLTLLITTPFDPEPAYALGTSLEMLDGFGPQDLEALQDGLLASFADCVPTERKPALIPRMARLLFALGAGCYTGVTRRAKALDMSAMSRMSHDLKTPINAITGFSRVILKGIDGPITDFQQEDLTSIYEAGQRLLTMINDIFSVRKRDAARTLVYAPPFAAVDLFADVLRTIQPIAAEREHAVQMRLARDLGLLDLDASMVRWVLLSVLQYVVRRSTGSVISVEVDRQVGEQTWLTTHIGYRLTDAVLAYREATAEEAQEDVEDIEDLAIITCRRFCDELGGEFSRVEDQQGVTFTIRLPSVPGEVI